jgi:hypothetical protein
MTMPLRHKTVLTWSVVLAVLVLSLQAGFADDTDNPRIKRVYTDEDAPPAIRFRHLLLMLSRDGDRQQERVARRLKEIGFDTADTPTVQDYLESLYVQVQGEIDEGIWRVACQQGASDLDGLEIRVVYNSFDEIRFAVAAKYLAIASAELAGMGYTDFGRMIELYPGQGASLKTISTDHRFAWGDSSDGIRQNRAELCRGIGERLERYFE